VRAEEPNDMSEHSNSRPTAAEATTRWCGGCGAGETTRRGFLGQVSGAVVAALVASELIGGKAAALPVTEASGTQVGGSEHAFPIPAADGVTIDRDTQVILVRVQQHVYAFNLACPHENTALRWRAGEARFQCPRHESKYQPDGTFISGRATRNMDRFAIKRAGDTVVVDLARLFRSDHEQAQWAAAVVAL
jgi:Rieske Fe-S protein